MDEFKYDWKAEYAFSPECQQEREEYEAMLQQEYEEEEAYLRTHIFIVDNS